MAATKLTADTAPYGPDAPAQDCVILSAPASDYAIGFVARAFMLLTDGTVSVVTAKGNTRTFDSKAGTQIPVMITDVLAATTAELMLLVS